MKHKLLFTSFLISASALLHAQCVSMSCPTNINTVSDSGSCGAVVNFALPQASSTCIVASDSSVFNFTGAVQTFTVPQGVTSVIIKTWGAQGGANWVNNVNYGGYVQGTVAVTPGQTLYVYVGGQSTSTAGGFNGGGAGDGIGKGGGGGTDVRTISNDLNSRLIVAGGGGGAGYWSSLHVYGGVGGGLIGGDGYRNTTADMGGLGATQTGPGASGTCVNFNMTTMAGGFGFGGTPLSFNCGCEGYGGGGGWYGGAGSGNCRGGGGGSGYAIPAATNVVMNSGVRAGNGKVVISYLSTSTPVVTQTVGLPSGSVFPIGTTTNSFLADDGFGNTAVCAFTVTVTDNEAPVITAVPQNITVTTDSGLCSAVVNWNAPVINDNCTISSVSVSDSSGSTFATGTHTVTYIAIDASGNADTASFTIVVLDEEAPGITCPQDITIAVDSGFCTATISNIGSAQTSDNCGISAVVNDATSFIYPLGVTSVTWTVTDGSGNTSTCQQTITVIDTTAPQFNSLPLNIQLCLGDTLLFALPVASDICSPVSVTQVSGPASGSLLSAGSYTLQFSAADTSGNISLLTHVVTVLDPGVTLALTASTLCEDDGSITLNGGSPVGGIWSGNAVTGNVFSPSVAGAGTYVISYTYTDFNGCTGVANDTLVVQECTGIATTSAGVLELYPNPASAEFLFVSSGNGILEIVSASGQLVASRRITSTRETINTSEMASGVYLVRYTLTSGASSTTRLVIQR